MSSAERNPVDIEEAVRTRAQRQSEPLDGTESVVRARFISST
jgi:hypothetical protein